LHFEDTTSFHYSNKGLSSGPVIACAHYSKFRSSRNALKKLFHGVHVIFQDAGMDKVCFMATHPDKSMEKIINKKSRQTSSSIPSSWGKRLMHGAAATVGQSTDGASDSDSDANGDRIQNRDHFDGDYEALESLGEFSTWHFMHPALKVHQTVLQHLFQSDNRFAEVADHHKKEGLESNSKDEEKGKEGPDLRYELIVDFVPKVEKEGAAKSTADVLESLHEHLHSTDNTRALLEDMQGAHSDAGELWEMGHSCANAAIFDHDENSNGRRLQFSSIVDQYNHGFKIMSDHLHGWGDRSDHRRKRDIDYKRRELAEDIGGISAGCYVAMLAKLALHPDVLSISVRPRPMLTNDAAKSVMMSNNLSVPVTTEDEAFLWPFQDIGLDGTGQQVTIADTGLMQDHCVIAADASDTGIAHISYGQTSFDDSYRKLIQYVAYVDSEDGDGHGTHVSGSSVGANYGSDNQYDGMAIGGKLCFFDIGDQSSGALYLPDPFYNLFVAGSAAGSRVFSGSFGYAYNYYSTDSVSVDTYAYTINPFHLAIFSAGNEGQEGYYTVIDPAVAKNALAVGSSESSFHGSSSYYRDGNIDFVPYFSSMGPTFDFRYKPDVVLPGMSINSAEDHTSNTCSFTESMGTSMSAGLMGGIALIIRQFYTNDTFSAYRNFYSSLYSGLYGPSNALLKATIIHSGRQMGKYNVPTGADVDTIIQRNLDLNGTTYNEDPMDRPAIGKSAQRPDWIQGFGRVDLSNVLPVNMTSHWEPLPDFSMRAHDFGIYENDADYWWLKMPASLDTSVGARGLKATLVWSDYPNDALAEKYLLHDLDLVIEKVDDTADCTTNAPTAAKPIWFGNGGSEPDTHNNVEMIHIPAEALEAGATYRVLVRSKTFVDATTYQYYAVVITYPSSLDQSSDGEYWFRNGATGNGLCDSTEFLNNYWEKSLCDPDTHLETEFYITSHRGDGWASSGTYSIVDNDSGAVVKSGGMNSSDVMSAVREKITVCLEVDKEYTVSLSDSNTSTNSGGDWGLYNMGIISTQCKVHLQGRHQTSATLTIESRTGDMEADDYSGMVNDFTCNACSSDEKEVDLWLWSSLYGGKISYGWQKDTSYKIMSGDNNSDHITSAPNVGLVERHRYCLANGNWYIGYDSISPDDDFYALGTYDSSFSTYYGVEEYEIDVYVCQNYIDSLSAYSCYQTASGIACWMAPVPYYSYTSVSDDTCLTDDDEGAVESYLAIIIFIVLAVCFCGALIAVAALNTRRLLRRATNGTMEMTNRVVGDSGHPSSPGLGLGMLSSSHQWQGVPTNAHVQPAYGHNSGVMEVQAMPVYAEPPSYAQTIYADGRAGETVPMATAKVVIN
jgi:hypothetical protein